jgi:hypothetical protein
MGAMLSRGNMQRINAVQEHRESMPNTQRLCLLACFRGAFACPSPLHIRRESMAPNY